MNLTELYDEILDEDYPPSFSMDDFKALTSFNARVRYCQQHLRRISSGSGRIVYQIDDEKVLKLAKNKKGVAQNEVEIDFGEDSYLKDTLAIVFDSHERALWVEMELARKLTYPKFKQLTGFDFRDFADAVHNHDINTRYQKTLRYKFPIDKELVDNMWGDEFIYGIFDFIGSYPDVAADDLMTLSTYGIVKRDGEDAIVVIDYGLTSQVYDSYYS